MKSVPISLSIVTLLMVSALLSSCGTSRTPPAPPPPPATCSVAFTVVNLAGTGGGLVLQNNATQSLPVNTNGSFTFSTSVASRTPYNITISTQPTSPAQTCGLTNASGVNSSTWVDKNGNLWMLGGWGSGGGTGITQGA